MNDQGDGLLRRMRSEAEKIFYAALSRVDPYEAVKRFIQVQGRKLLLGQGDRPDKVLLLEEFNRVFLVGGGKATARMAKAVEDLLGKRIVAGVVNVKYGFTEALSRTEIVEAGHPLPDQNGVAGTKHILEILRAAEEKDLVFSLISGGGSALLVQPVDGITLEEKQAVTRSLLACGASIDEINAVRKHISSSKGGQLARAAYPATTLNLMLSDVVGDRADVIASGPFVPDTSTFEEAWAVLEKYRLGNVPRAVRDYLQKGMAGKVPETPKAGNPIFDKVSHLIIGSNISALEAASEEAERMGYASLILSSMVEGETREVARVHTAIAKEVLKSGRPLPPPVCIISGGETTVTIKGKGLGGRNQEFCLASVLDLEGLPQRAVLLSGGTDGNDGPTDAAGAIVDPATARRAREQGLSASEYLERNDAYHFFQKAGGLLMTGPTKTNVMDVRIILVK
ncbi:MAG: glycerate kinase [Deltaproteobacteria bacterium]